MVSRIVQPPLQGCRLYSIVVHWTIFTRTRRLYSVIQSCRIVSTALIMQSTVCTEPHLCKWCTILVFYMTVMSHSVLPDVQRWSMSMYMYRVSVCTLCTSLLRLAFVVYIVLGWNTVWTSLATKFSWLFIICTHFSSVVQAYVHKVSIQPSGTCRVEWTVFIWPQNPMNSMHRLRES